MIFYFCNRPLLLSPGNPKVADLSRDQNWDAEVKKNGTRLTLQYTMQSKVKSFDDFLFWERHKKILKYEPIKEVLDELKSLNLPLDTHIDAELLHFKTKHIKHRIYIYDLYAYGGKLMMDELKFRRERLHDIFKGRKFNFLEIAKTYPTGFKSLFNKVIKNEEDEGLVMKNKNGKIEWNAKRSPDVAWQIKIRRSHSNYAF